MMKNVYGVSQINRYIKNMFAQDFMLKNVCVKGEVSNCKYHTSGHIYFTLKENGSAMNAIMFAGNRRGLGFSMKDGDQVQVTGSIEVYERDGRYQIYAREITLAGEGDLYIRFEQLKHELEEMGMFAAEYKKPVPKFASRIGIVTAPTGAAIQDIRNIASRRNPYVQLILYPALVQGEGAAASIVNGIRALDSMNLDVLIVGRGGGSIEDLWAFNEEEVARAVFECRTPVISAVGHETDTTIADYVADLRAPTPSAAAELAVFDIRSLIERMESMRIHLYRSMAGKLRLAQSQMNTYKAELNRKNPMNRMNEKKQYMSELSIRMEHLMVKKITERKMKLALLSQRLDDISPLKRLGQGYAYVKDAGGQGLNTAEQLTVGDFVEIRLRDGRIEAEVTKIEYQSEHSS